MVLYLIRNRREVRIKKIDRYFRSLTGVEMIDVYVTIGVLVILLENF